MADDRRLIEDYLPIRAISERASSEPRTKGHISTLHLWRARRPLVACRAAVYGALVPLSRFSPTNGAAERVNSLSRANAAQFIERLCTYPGSLKTIGEARKHIVAAQSERLAKDSDVPLSTDELVPQSDPRPKVLDMFAGGGAIPLEALRLGCDAHAVELNPVAHLIELCTVTYPQQFGASLADDIELWGNRILESTRSSIRDLYAVLPVPGRSGHEMVQSTMAGVDVSAPHSDLSVVAYYWTRTVPCPNPSCGGTVPLFRQTWLRNKKSGMVALRPQPDFKTRRVTFEIAMAEDVESLGFDPSEGSKGTATDCPFCRAPVAAAYVREYGKTKGFGQQLMCAIALNYAGSGKLYIADDSLADGEADRQRVAGERAIALEVELGNSSLDEKIPPTGNAGLATGKSYLYGIETFRQAFTPRQLCVLLTMSKLIRESYGQMVSSGMDTDRAKAVTTYLGLWLSRLTDKYNTLTRWNSAGEKVEGISSMKRFAMTWDYPEVNLFGGGSGDAASLLGLTLAVVRQESGSGRPATCVRSSATDLPYGDETFDAIVTDPPYYDNESYSEISDASYIWLRSSLAFLYPEHFSTSLTPKRREVVAAAYRQGGALAAKEFYEQSLLQSLREASRVLKRSGTLVMVYAHKTTVGWSTLVDAVRRARFEVVEAWPVETEKKGRAAHQDDAALASNIFLVARKRESSATGSYEDDVQPELERIVRERVETLWGLGIAGADLVIAAVGAGLRAFTRFEQVEYANGDPVPAERFLAEVEGVVLEALLEQIFNVPRSGVAAVDGPSRFYVLWRYTYKATEMEAGEAIVFTYGQRVELDGPRGLSQGGRALVEKKQGKYRLRDFTERGRDERLGLPADDGTPAPLIDVLHRVLWLIEYDPRSLIQFLDEARPDRERLRLVAQALAGAGLKGKSEAEARTLVATTTSEQAALGKLMANWRTLIESSARPLL